eukprot:CAMPEP_0206230872 /NCGR_PEP_ID=MMETSP0047_2-20121206/10518_1 /ASSEMBLY_ACC=CAM_ASM_000192 /TAXON_ID=195065 /ORGANISM="Chroomonas mesostigmatica_cf, Strain CCMP1168" /LENGTH=111 /DNA_ID=CAMNT_0053654379 /DNA_START=26 /DNA_END=361 /DNA_ORIENTATION=+
MEMDELEGGSRRPRGSDRVVMIKFVPPNSPYVKDYENYQLQDGRLNVAFVRRRFCLLNVAMLDGTQIVPDHQDMAEVEQLLSVRGDLEITGWPEPCGVCTDRDGNTNCCVQ